MAKIITELTVDELVERLAAVMQPKSSNIQAQIIAPDDLRFHGDKALGKYLGCTIQTINKLKKAGLPSHRSGRKYYYIRQEVDIWTSRKNRKFGQGHIRSG
jgi:hypothetical protein